MAIIWGTVSFVTGVEAGTVGTAGTGAALLIDGLLIGFQIGTLLETVIGVLVVWLLERRNERRRNAQGAVLPNPRQEDGREARNPPDANQV